jgi:AbrB family looped-hinge helix DNA binding protein
MYIPMIVSYTMANVVGTKGQVVINKEIRDKLGIGPGWLALQRLVDGHVEIYFVMPEHNRSLKGSLAPYTDVVIAPGEEWEKAREKAWEAAARERVERWDKLP